MKTNDFSLQVKRSYKKLVSQNVAIKLKVYIENNHPEDEQYLKKMDRQLACSYLLKVYDNGSVTSHFCYQKTCLICNSIRLAKFLTKYLELINIENARYHMVLSIKNPSAENLKEEIDRMYKFFQQSSIKKNKRFRELNKRIKMIRSFEATLNKNTKSFNIHFHLLLAGEIETELDEYGKIVIAYWLKYFKEKAHKDAQYLEKQKKSVLENFKYLVKLKGLEKGDMPMFYQLLKATEGKRLFTAKGFSKSDVQKQLEELRTNVVEDSKATELFIYKKEHKNWIDEETGEIFINDEKIEHYENEIIEKKNLIELKKYFNNVSSDKAH